MQQEITRKVARDGITYNGRRYFNKQLLSYIGIVVNVSQISRDCIAVFHNNELICNATPVAAVHHG